MKVKTVKVKYRDNKTGEVFEILFGNSYKPWRMQKEEYERTFKDEEVLEVSQSNTRWIGWGGLKWCQLYS